MKKNSIKHRVKRHKYFYITTVVLVLFLVFQLIGNFVYVLITSNQKDSKDKAFRYEDLVPLNYEKAQENDDWENVVFYRNGSRSADMIQRQLANQKENYHTVSSLDEIKEDTLTGTRILWIAQADLTAEEIKRIKEINQKGIHVIFGVMPEADTLALKETKELLGIYQYFGQETEKGIRYITDFFIGEGFALEKLSFTYESVSLVSGCKTFAYCLKENAQKRAEKKLKNEELPPLIWRYINGGGEIFVINADLMEQDQGTGIVASIFAKIYDSYLYPVVNAYSFLMKDFPYVENVTSEELTRLYSRDALKLQQDILFPDIIKVVKQYNLRPTYYSAAYQELKRMEDDKLRYYGHEIVSQLGEFAYYDKGRDALYTFTAEENQQMSMEKEKEELFMLADSVVTEWKPEQGFGEEKTLYFPALPAGDAKRQEEILKIKAGVTANGYLSMLLNIRTLIQPENGEKAEDWVEIGKDLEGMLYAQNKEYGYLTRLTASDALERILLFLQLDPEISYQEDRIEVNCRNFFGEGYFFLRTRRPIREVSNGRFSKINGSFYLIQAEEASISIIFE